MDSVMNCLDGLSKEKLVSLLKNVVSECGKAAEDVLERSIDRQCAAKPRRVYEQNEMDMSKYHQRQIALQIQYEGSFYFGFATQGDEDTVEKHIFLALKKLKLIEDIKTCNYSRCGRTDKGVSALGQVVSVKVRSAFPREAAADPHCVLPIHPGDETSYEMNDPSSGKAKNKVIKEMDYAVMLNKALPESIRVLGWCEVSPDFNARFSAAHRGYRYFFVEGNRNIAAMKTAASYLVGTHDFRNLAKLDVENVSNFKREVFSAEIVLYEECIADHTKSVWMLEIKGIAFLWHMVRCIMAVLLMVGDHDEKPEIVKRLLDIQEFPAKPTYQMANELPLVLHECGYDNLSISAMPKNLWNLTHHYEDLLEQHRIAAMRAQNALQFIRGSHVRAVDLRTHFSEMEDKFNSKVRGRGGRKVLQLTSAWPADNTLVPWADVLESVRKELGMDADVSPSPYTPVLERKCEETLDEKVNNLSGKKRERLDRHIELTREMKAETPKFFKRMRMQGSLQPASESSDSLSNL